MLSVLLTLVVLGAEPPPESAEALAHRSIVEYDLGQFEKALEDATRSYELDPHPELLFNIGQCHRALGHWQQAEFFYRGYLRQRPDTPSRPKVEALIAKMVAKQQENAPPPAPVVLPVPLLAAPTVPEIAASPPPVTAPEAPSAAVAAETAKPASTSWDQRVPTGAWWVGGAGAGCLIAGGIFGAIAASTQNSDTTMPGPGSSTIHSLSLSKLNQANTDAQIANVLFITGGVLLVGAVTWALIAPRHPGPSTDGVVHF